MFHVSVYYAPDVASEREVDGDLMLADMGQVVIYTFVPSLLAPIPFIGFLIYVLTIVLVI